MQKNHRDYMSNIQKIKPNLDIQVDDFLKELVVCRDVNDQFEYTEDLAIVLSAGMTAVYRKQQPKIDYLLNEIAKKSPDRAEELANIINNEGHLSEYTKEERVQREVVQSIYAHTLDESKALPRTAGPDAKVGTPYFSNKLDLLEETNVSKAFVLSNIFGKREDSIAENKLFIRFFSKLVNEPKYRKTLTGEQVLLFEGLIERLSQKVKMMEIDEKVDQLKDIDLDDHKAGISALEDIEGVINQYASIHGESEGLNKARMALQLSKCVSQLGKALEGGEDSAETVKTAINSLNEISKDAEMVNIVKQVMGKIVNSDDDSDKKSTAFLTAMGLKVRSQLYKQIDDIGPNGLEQLYQKVKDHNVVLSEVSPNNIASYLEVSIDDLADFNTLGFILMSLKNLKLGGVLSVYAFEDLQEMKTRLEKRIETEGEIGSERVNNFGLDIIHVDEKQPYTFNLADVNFMLKNFDYIQNVLNASKNTILPS